MMTHLAAALVFTCFLSSATFAFPFDTNSDQEKNKSDKELKMPEQSSDMDSIELFTDNNDNTTSLDQLLKDVAVDTNAKLNELQALKAAQDSKDFINMVILNKNETKDNINRTQPVEVLGTNDTVTINTTAIDNNMLLALENEKLDLFKQISLALADSEKTIQSTNDSEAVLGMVYLDDLKRQIDNIKTSFDNEISSNRTDGWSDKLNLTRRSDGRKKNSLRQLKVPALGVSDRELFNDVEKLKKNPRDQKKFQDRLKNRMKVKKQIEDWLLQRDLEKAKIKLYKESFKTTKPEKCPNEGVEIKSQDVGFRSKKVLGKYPCCRKCCKRSDMGCL